MEFNEKLQELRKARSMTQEELAEALFVSRTAISKWESGRGYPNLDSLKEISKYFSISIDELICSEEIISVAQDDKKEFIDKYVSLICCTLDILQALMFLLPIFGNGLDSNSSVSLYAITGIDTWIKTIFFCLVGLMFFNGIGGIIIRNFDKTDWNSRILVIGMVLSILGVAIFIMTRQPYAGIICLAVLVMKGLLIVKRKA